jgi:energy-coupling factor transport system permease protein
MFFVFRPGNSFMHRMDSVSKLIWLFIVTFIVILTTRAVENLVIFLWIVLVGLILAQLPPFFFLRRLLPLLLVSTWLLIIMTALYPRGITPLARFGPIQVTYEGLDYGLALFFRIMSLGTSSVVFTLTTEPRRMINELIVIAGLPYRWAYAIYAALRFVPLLQLEATNILNAHMVRGAAEKSTLLDRITPIKRLTLPLLTGAIRRIQITAIAMDSRGFGAFPFRTNIEPIEAFPAGVAFTLMHVVALLAFSYWHFVYGGGGLLIAPITGN